MDPSALIPVPDSIPVHWAWLDFFFILTFVLHLLFMNAMVGSAVIAMVRSIRSNLLSHDLTIAKHVSQKLPYTIAFTVNMGVAPLLFIQVLYGGFIYTSSVLMGWYWLSIIGIVITAYYCAYIFDFRFDSLGRSRTIFISASVILMLVTGFLFTCNMTLMLTPEKWVQYFSNPRGTILNLSQPMLIPRYLHFVCASIAVGGLFLALFGKVKTKGEEDNEMIMSGMKWFFNATFVQIIIGIWFAASLPQDIVHLFLGRSTSATLYALGALAGAAAALFFGYKRQVWQAAASLVFTVIFMALVRNMVRIQYLKPYFTLSDLKISPQYIPMALFIVTLAAGSGLIFYMVRLASKVKKEEA